MHIDISKAIGGLKHLTEQLSEAKVRLGVSRAINHALAKGKTVAKKEITSTYNIKPSTVSKALVVKKSQRTELRGELQVSGAPIPIAEFSADARPYQTKRGVSVVIFKGKRKLINSAFIPKGSKRVRARGAYENGQFVFRRHRIVKKGMDYPIPQIMTTSVPLAFKSERVISKVVANLEDNYTNRLAHELQYLITKL